MSLWNGEWLLLSIALALSGVSLVFVEIANRTGFCARLGLGALVSAASLLAFDSPVIALGLGAASAFAIGKNLEPAIGNLSRSFFKGGTDSDTRKNVQGKGARKGKVKRQK